MRGVSLVVLAASAIHCLWAALLLVPHYNAERATPVSSIFTTIGIDPSDAWASPLTAAWLAIIGLFAAWGVLQRSPALVIRSMIPQQMLLGVSAWGSTHAIWTSQYADGVARDRGFIMADQFPSVMLWVAHTAAILLVFNRFRKAQSV